MKVSILILTHNEAANLPACLGALSWCHDIVVVDSGSEDRTVAIAQGYGARILHRPFDNFAGQRNFGLHNGCFRHDWVLHLDADEVVTQAFAGALAALEPNGDLDAWRVPFKTIFFGTWLRHSGMWPTYQVRLGHVLRLRFVQIGHGQREALPPQRVGVFPEALLHNSFSLGLKHWLYKHIRYAYDEARVIVDPCRNKGAISPMLFARDGMTRFRAAKSIALDLPPFTRPVARFLYIYFYRRGFLDGKAGFVYAVMLAVYEAMIAILVYEMRNQNASGSSETLSSPRSNPSCQTST
jgi:glycosyltransferase involved in cell wall biosynthesis